MTFPRMAQRTAAGTVFATGMLVLALILQVSAAPTVTGRWWADIDNQTPYGGRHYTFDLKANGKKLTGTVDSEGGRTKIEEGRVAGNSVFFVESIVFASDIIRVEYAGTFSGDEIRFTRSIEDYEPETFIAKRSK
jgi:hypothetical protein